MAHFTSPSAFSESTGLPAIFLAPRRAQYDARCAPAPAAVSTASVLPTWSGVDSIPGSGTLSAMRSENGPLSQKAFSLHPMHGCPEPIGKLVPPFHFTVEHELYVIGPRQPILYRHQPLRAPSSSQLSTNCPASKNARR